MRAMRVLETAVGVALGPVKERQRTDLDLSRACDRSIPKDDRHRFRLMAERREAWWRELAEIHLRACVRIGELSRELERAERQRGEDGRLQMRVPADRVPAGRNPVTKTQALADAGIPTSTAHDYEQLAGGREAQARKRQAHGQTWNFRTAPSRISPAPRPPPKPACPSATPPAEMRLP
jgi:hypothetical protein